MRNAGPEAVGGTGRPLPSAAEASPANPTTLTVPDAGSAELVEAVAGYSNGRHRVVERQDRAARVAPRFEVALYGYDIGQVDALVRRVETALSADDAVSRRAVRDELAAGPALHKRPRGYQRTEVENYLRRMTLRLDQPGAA